MTLYPTPCLAAIGDIPWPFYLAPLGGVTALVTAAAIARAVRARPEGDAEMVRIAAAVRQGAMAYLKRQYRVVAIVFLILVVLLGVLAFFRLQPAWSMVGVPLAGLLSGLTGWFGMRMATDASARTAAAARESLNDGLTVAFRAGAVMGLGVVGFAVLDVSFWFVLFNAFGARLGLDPSSSPGLVELTTVMLSYGMGASLQALFARVGGGIFTKAADVGADLVGKVEAGIPEDDARNPATIADNVGDNVGDVAGMGADLYESYYGSILATVALGAAAAFALHDLADSTRWKVGLLLAAAPIAVAAVGILASIAGIFAVRTHEGASFGDLLSALRRGVYLASLLFFIAAFGVLFLLLGPGALAPELLPCTWWQLGLSITAGLVAGLVIARATEYSTSQEHGPTQRIAVQALTGPATVIIAGIAEGMKSTWASLVSVAAAIIVAFIAAGGGEHFLMGLYGVAIAAVGMLATLGITLATDAYGPVADNAGGNAEMSGQDPQVRQRTDMLDSLGNTTAATGKGFAIGSAALTAMALLAAYIQVVQTQLDTQSVRFGQRLNLLDTQGTAGSAGTPFAIYEGSRRFAIFSPGGRADGGNYIGGAILTDRGAVPGGRHFYEAVRPGSRLTVEGAHGAPGGHHDGHDHSGAARPEGGLNAEIPGARALTLSATVQHEGHEDEFEVTVVPTASASVEDILRYYNVTVVNPRVLGGLFLGVMLTFLFCALTMNAVGRSAYRMMRECRRQFAIMREAFRRQGMSEAQIADARNWPKQVTSDGKQYPDYATCVSISTAGAQREMLLPSSLAVLVPLAVGVVLGVPGVIGLLAGGLTCGFAVAVFMANAGGAWDNAKKLVESAGRVTADAMIDDPAVRARLPEELREPLLARAQDLRRADAGATIIYGKGSDDHKATVVGDTVGDPFKDTSGPSLNILIKLISIVSVVFAGVVVKYGAAVGQWIGLD